MTLLFFLSSLDCYTRIRELLTVPLDSQTVCTPRGQHTLLILSLSPGMYGSSRSLGAWLAGLGKVGRFWSGSKVPLHHSFRVTLGLEHLPQVSDLLPPWTAITYLLSSVSQTLDDTSFDLGRMVRVEVEVPVRVSLLAEDWGKDLWLFFSSCTLRKAILPSDSFSTVNWIEGFCSLRCQWNSSSSQSPWGRTTRTSSTYLRHIFGFQVEVFRARVSRSSIKILATIGEGGNPLLLLLPARRRTRRTDNRWITGIAPPGHRGRGWGCLFCPWVCRPAEAVGRRLGVLHPLVTSSLVNRLTTSKLTMTSVSSREVWWISFTKSAEFLTWDGLLPASGERILANSLANWCVGEPMAATIGQRGMPSLWIFGRL